MKVLVINGPNMQLLGRREPGVYGSLSYADLTARIEAEAAVLQLECRCFQSNHEGDIVDVIGRAPDEGFAAIIINPAAYTHTSIAIHDALKAVDLPAIEVHISNIHARESFRDDSVTAPACIGMIAGLGIDGYLFALQALKKRLMGVDNE